MASLASSSACLASASAASRAACERARANRIVVILGPESMCPEDAKRGAGVGSSSDGVMGGTGNEVFVLYLCPDPSFNQGLAGARRRLTSLHFQTSQDVSRMQGRGAIVGSCFADLAGKVGIRRQYALIFRSPREGVTPISGAMSSPWLRYESTHSCVAGAAPLCFAHGGQQPCKPRLGKNQLS